jgi:hypothetical protein
MTPEIFQLMVSYQTLKLNDRLVDEKIDNLII